MKRYEPMAHRLGSQPTVTAEDWRALLWLIAFAVLFVAITAVESPQ